MRRAASIAVALGFGLFAASILSGCGKKPKNDPDPEPTGAVSPTTPTPPTPQPKFEPKPDPEPDPSPFGKYGTAKLPPVVPYTPGLPPPGGVALAPPPLGVGEPRPPAPPTPEPKPLAPLVPPDPPGKEPAKDPNKPADWPTAWFGKPMSEYIKEINDADPAIRETALRTLPNFGPAAREPATKLVIRHMVTDTERDPGVRAAAFEAMAALATYSKNGELPDSADTTEAIRILRVAADRGIPGGGTRLHAVQTLASFGPRAEIAITELVGANMTTPSLEPAYTTRAAIATTLGSIAFNEKLGPNRKALDCLCHVLLKDPSAVVRLAAYQSLFVLGPPYLPPPKAPPAPGMKNQMQVDEKVVEGYVKSIKARLAPYKPEPGVKEKESPTGLMERDRQVEIFARLSTIRLDPKEYTRANVKEITKYLDGPPNETGTKMMALSALSIMGEFGADFAVDDVVKTLTDEDPGVASAAVATLVSMGTKAKGAIPFLEKLKMRGSKKDEKDAKDYPKEYWNEVATRAIKAINEAKPAVAKP